MLVKRDEIYDLLRCPVSGSRLERVSGTSMRSLRNKLTEYRIVNNLPVLIDFNKSILNKEDLFKNFLESPVRRNKRNKIVSFIRNVLSPIKKITKINVKEILYLLTKAGEDTKVLVIGGGSIGQGMMPIYDHPDLKIISFDIYQSKYVQFLADAHNIPLKGNYFDCVIIQAVLEHVLYPRKVVDEITRVLKKSGIVYSETPFLQQVHEGPYDFTRFTDSGHRFLFKNYEVLKSGSSSGPGVQMLWTIDYFFRSVFRSNFIGKLFKSLFFWLVYVDNIIPEKYSVDSASGTFFLGRKTEKELLNSNIVGYYKGAQ